MQNKIIIAIQLLLTLPLFLTAQMVSTNNLSYEVNKVHPYISVDRSDLKEAQTLTDLNARYKSDWVKTYISVEVVTVHKGQSITTIGNSHGLTAAQKEQMMTADIGTAITVYVNYLPDNKLVSNEVKETNFTFTVNPDQDASYIGGTSQLEGYLKEMAIDKIPSGSFEGYDMLAVKFTIDETGKVVDTHLFETSINEEVDQLLLETISNMPAWTPASYADGTRVPQVFALTVGNMENCIVHLLNIK